MAALSATWTTKTVKITYRNPLTRVKEGGSWVAETTGRVTNTLTDGTKQVFRPGKFDQGNLNIVEGSPSLQVDIPVIDDPDNSPQGGSVRLTITFSTGGAESFTLFPLSNWASVTDIGDLLDPTITPGVATYVIKGVAGGVAALDSDGDVVNAAGIKVTGSGGGGGSSITTEAIQDIVGGLITGGSGISVVYDDPSNSMVISYTGGTGGTSYTDEQVRDTIATALRTTGYVSLAVDDANDTITLGSTTALQTALDSKLTITAAQTTTTAQKIQGLSNLGIVSSGSGVGTVIIPQSAWTATDRSAALDIGWWKGDAGSTTTPATSKMGVNDYYMASPA